MIEVTKAEADIIRKKYPNIHMKRTVNRYYAEESSSLLRFLGRDKHQQKGGASR